MSQDKPVILIVNSKTEDKPIISQSFDEIYKNNVLYYLDKLDDINKFLSKSDGYSVQYTPDLIICNIDSTQQSGYSQIAELKNKSEFKFIPIITFVNQKDEESIHKFYDSYINACIVYPEDNSQLKTILHFLANFWLHIAKLPFNN